jgi:hypothetical protein
MRVLFETGGERDFANAVIMWEVEDTLMSYIERVKLFLMACELGLLDMDD